METTFDIVVTRTTEKDGLYTESAKSYRFDAEESAFVCKLLESMQNDWVVMREVRKSAERIMDERGWRDCNPEEDEEGWEIVAQYR